MLITAVKPPRIEIFTILPKTKAKQKKIKTKTRHPVLIFFLKARISIYGAACYLFIDPFTTLSCPNADNLIIAQGSLNLRKFTISKMTRGRQRLQYNTAATYGTSGVDPLGYRTR